MAITALGNTYCTIGMNLKHRADVNTIADACLLDLDQREHLGRLPVGSAIVKLQDRWASPFLVRFPLMEISKGTVSDGVLVLLTLPDRLSSLDRARLCPIAAIPLPSPEAVAIPASSAPPKVAKAALSDEARRLLADVAAEPSSGVTQRYSRLGLSRREGTALKETLVRDELVREVFVSLPGGRVTLLEPTEQGWKILGEEGPPARHGGPVHRFWVAEDRESILSDDGFEVDLEAPQEQGRTLDLVARRADAVVAVEVEVSGRRLEASLEKLRQTGASRKVLACADKGVMDRARALVTQPTSPTAIEVVHVWSFLTKQKRRPPPAAVPAGAVGSRAAGFQAPAGN